MKSNSSVINVGKGKQRSSYIMQIKAHFIITLQICFAHSMIGWSIVNLLCYCVCGGPRPSSDLLVLFVISNWLYLVITSITAYLITTNDHSQDRRSRWLAIGPVYWQRQVTEQMTASGITCTQNISCSWHVKKLYLSFCTWVCQSPSLMLVNG